MSFAHFIFLKFPLATIRRWNRSFCRKSLRHATDKNVRFVWKMVDRKASGRVAPVAVVHLKIVHKSFMSHVHKPTVCYVKMFERIIVNIRSIVNSIDQNSRSVPKTKRRSTEKRFSFFQKFIRQIPAFPYSPNSLASPEQLTKQVKTPGRLSP